MKVKALIPIVATAILSCLSPSAFSAPAEVTLTFSSWRTEDVERMNKLFLQFTAKNPGIKINYQPISDTEYNDKMKAELAAGKGADLVYLRAFDLGQAVYKGGWLYDLTKAIPNLGAFSPMAVNAWSSGKAVFGLPSVGVTHGVYYNKAIFQKYGLAEPKTWDEFIRVCETLKTNGETVIAQGANDTWSLYEVVFSGLGANFYGGEKARQALLAGKSKLTDPNFIEAFKAVYSLKKYFPKGYETLDYLGMVKLFGSGKAAMFIGGSWEIGGLADMGLDSSKLGWFVPPVVKAGDKLQYCFHVDAAIGVNKKSKHLKEALTFIKWAASGEYAQAIMNEVPGFFSYTPGVKVALRDPLAQKMFDASATSDLTIRTVYEKLSSRSPSGNALMGEVLPAMMVGKYTPEQAAAQIQGQLETWYAPFKK